MSTLYIIGNGFDLAHDLPTDYKNNLRPILRNTNEELLNVIDQLYFQGNEDLWSEFESRVGKIEEQTLQKLIELSSQKIQEFNEENSDPFAYQKNIESEQYGDSYSEVDDAIYSVSSNKLSAEEIIPYNEELEKIVPFLHEGMKRMICVANHKLKKTPKIVDFEEDAVFVNYNYTETLTGLYDIFSECILYLHGKENPIWGNDENEINFIDQFEIDFTNYAIEEDQLRHDEEGNFPSNIGDFVKAFNFEEPEQNEIKEAVIEVLNNTTSECLKERQIEELEEFLNEKDGIDRIVVLGHSMGSVDIDYFNYIKTKYPDANWIVSYYSDEDIVKENARQVDFYAEIQFEKFSDILMKLNNYQT